ncbi:MAG: TIGR02757 family protein [Chitinophagaceae bacterium]
MQNISQNIIYLLNKKVTQYNHIDFIENDPISIPHQFLKKQDIEIAAFFAAILAWGNRKSIITSCQRLMHLMDNSPYDFIMNIDEDDTGRMQDFEHFAHRTFNGIDAIRCMKFLQLHYQFLGEESLETAFTKGLQPNDENVENALNTFYQYFFSKEYFPDEESRTQKHIAAPFKKSACKRLNMFLRWMVRSDKNGVDFGIWKNIKPSQLIIPMDVHVVNVSNHLGLIEHTKTSWQAAVDLTNKLKKLDANDPVKYDYALFSLGVVEGLK